MADPSPVTVHDGTDPNAYRWLERLDRSGWAWEWLRRDPGYRGAGSEVPDAVAVPRVLPSDAADPERGLLFRRRPDASGA